MLNPKIGAVSFFQNFGNTLNVHPHFHLVVADGVFSVEEDTLLFCESCLDSEDIVDTEECIRKRVLLGKEKLWGIGCALGNGHEY